MIHTGSCGSPQALLQDIIVAVVSGYINELEPVMKGTTVNYTCLPGLVHTGPSSSTCTENGEWEPSLSNVECNGCKISEYVWGKGKFEK